MHLIRTFLSFGAFSGLGWLLDMLVYSTAVTVIDLPASYANFVSSFAGVTFVYFAALKPVFQKAHAGHRHFVLYYWAYQLVSIFLYSALLQGILSAAGRFGLTAAAAGYAAILAKMAITPLNLLTNFIFMKYLTTFMARDEGTHG